MRGEKMKNGYCHFDSLLITFLNSKSLEKRREERHSSPSAAALST